MRNPAVKTYEELKRLGVREANSYFEEFFEVLKNTSVYFKWPPADDIEKRGGKVNETMGCLIKILADIQNNGKKLMFIGNGGSTGIAAHALADYANAGGLKTISFYNPALLTCMANDYGYENVFVKPIEMFAERGDMLFAISSSGKSPNIVNAVKAAIDKGCIVVTFSGFSPDNPLRKLGRLNFYVPSSHYGFVELAHQTLIHCILDLYCRHKAS